jgi:uncharacterized membrane protein
MHEALLITHFLGLALGLGTGFSMMTLGQATRDMAPADRGAFMKRAMALSRNGSVGLLLLLVSGVGLVMLYGVAAVMALGGGLFHLKLTLVVILLGVFGYMQVLVRKARGGATDAMARIPVLSRLMLFLSTAIVIVAVLAFN